MRLISYFSTILVAGLLCTAGQAAMAKSKAHCKANAGEINFGSVAIRDGESNRTSTNVNIECRDIKENSIGVCIYLGSGHGNERGGETRYLKRDANNRISYVIRDGGYGSGYPLWDSGVFKRLPVRKGSVDASITAFAEILATGSARKSGTYKAPYPTGHSYVEIGVEGCGMPARDTTNIKGLSASANLTSSCEIDGASLGFGRIPAQIKHPIDASTDIAIRCTYDTPFKVRMDYGTGAGVKDPERRAMTNGGDTLFYGLYLDASRQRPWGMSDDNAFEGTGMGSSQHLEVHGRIHSGQSAKSGVYRDSVLITVEY